MLRLCRTGGMGDSGGRGWGSGEGGEEEEEGWGSPS